MDLQTVWNQLNRQQLQQPAPDKTTIQEAIHRQSEMPLARLRKALKLKLVLSILFGLAFTILLILYKEPIVKLLLGVLVLAYAAGSLYTWVDLRKMSAPLHLDTNLRETLQGYLNRMMRMLRNEENISLFIYPVSLSAGFFCGFLAKADMDKFFHARMPVFALLATIVVFVPLCHFTVKYLHRKFYGKYLKHLQELIDQLEAN